MNGHRQTFSCPSCGKRFTYWVADGNSQPKIKCSFCAKESFPYGEPPAAVVPAPPAPAAAATSATSATSAPAPAAPPTPKPPTA